MVIVSCDNVYKKTVDEPESDNDNTSSTPLSSDARAARRVFWCGRTDSKDPVAGTTCEFSKVLESRYIRDNSVLARYNILLFVLTYVLPMLGMAVCYVQMARHLCTKSALSLMAGQGQAALARSRRDKMKIVKMFALVVVIFMVCWAPYHIYFILSYHYPAITRQEDDVMSIELSSDIQCDSQLALSDTDSK